MTRRTKTLLGVGAGALLLWWLYRRDRSREPGTLEARGGRLLVDGQPFLNVEFAYDSAEVPGNAYPALNRIGAWMQGHPTASVEIRGHTDNVGSERYNWELAARRAQAIWQYLVSRDADGSRLHPVSKGETEPIASNDTEAGRAQNRRVEFVIVE